MEKSVVFELTSTYASSNMNLGVGGIYFVSLLKKKMDGTHYSSFKTRVLCAVLIFHHLT